MITPETKGLADFRAAWITVKTPPKIVVGIVRFHDGFRRHVDHGWHVFLNHLDDCVPAYVTCGIKF